MSQTRLLFALLVVVAAGCRRSHPTQAEASIAAVWAIGDGDGLDRDADEPPRTSLVWDGSGVKLFAARNEIVAFQLVVRAGRHGIAALRASLPTLDPVSGKRKIVYQPPGADPSEFRGRPIQIFSVGYQHVEHATRADFIYTPGGPDAPAHPTGWKPVQLVPENAIPDRGGFPLAVRPGENQALWFEVTTAHDLPVGSYHGTIEVTADAERARVPITLEVGDVTLPDENTLRAMAFFESGQPQLYQGDNLDAVYHRFAHRQRIELVNAYDQASIEAALGRFDGSDFRPAAGYEGPGEGVGNRIVPASFYGPGDGWQDRATAWKRADAWIAFLDRRVPQAITFLYMLDEPTEDQFPGIRAIADNLHSDPGPGQRLRTFATHDFTPDLAGAVDIWCAVPALYDPKQATEQRGQGKESWFYNGGRPAGPALVIDAPPSDARVIGWAAFKVSAPGYFYWHAVHWQHNSSKKLGDRNQNVWANPITFDTRDEDGKGDYANGEGVLLYPGTERLHPDEDRGIDGPISTLRLANLRRGLQDHIYLTLARQRGLGPLVDELLATIVPHVFAGAGPRVSFPERSEPFERARLRLLQALAGKR